MPNLVATVKETGQKSLYYNDIIAIVVVAIQQQVVEHQALAGTVVDHEERIKLLEEEIMRLKEGEILFR
jgi:hypothetical protein